MKQRTSFFLCIACLFIGGMLYILFRENTHIGKLFTHFPAIAALRTSLKPFACNLFQFYLPDFLWCLSLACGLQAALGLQRKGILLCGFGAVFCGVVWECLQFLGAVSGTGDVLDIVSYLLAGILCIILNLKETEK